MYIADLTLVVISYEMYETSLEYKILFIIWMFYMGVYCPKNWLF